MNTTSELDLALQLAKHAVRLDSNKETWAAVDAYERVIKLLEHAQEKKIKSLGVSIQAKIAEYSIRMYELKGLHFANQACELDAKGEVEAAQWHYQQAVASYLQLSKVPSPAAQVLVEKLSSAMKSYMDRAEEIHEEITLAKLATLNPIPSARKECAATPITPGSSPQSGALWQPSTPTQPQQYQTQQAQHRQPKPMPHAPTHQPQLPSATTSKIPPKVPPRELKPKYQQNKTLSTQTERRLSKVEFDEADFGGETKYDLSTTCQLELSPDEQDALVQPFVEAVNQNKILRKRYSERGKDMNSFEFVREYYENYSIARQSQQVLIQKFETKRKEDKRKLEVQQEKAKEKPDDTIGTSRGKKLVMGLGLQNAKWVFERLTKNPYGNLPEEKNKNVVDDEWLKEIESVDSSAYRADLIAGHLVGMLRNKDHPLGRRLAVFTDRVVLLCNHNPKEKSPAEHLEDTNAILRDWISRTMRKIISKFPPLEGDAYLVKVTVQYVLFNLIFPHLFELYKKKHEPEDSRYTAQLQRIRDLKDPASFYVRPQLCLEKSGGIPYEQAITSLRKINLLKTPLEKCNCLSDASHDIIKAVDDYQKARKEHPFVLGADDLLPIYTYVVARAQPSFVYSEIMFLHDWLSERALIGEEGYNFATFETALMSTLQIDPQTAIKNRGGKEPSRDRRKGEPEKRDEDERDTMTEEEILELMAKLAEPLPLQDGGSGRGQADPLVAAQRDLEHRMEEVTHTVQTELQTEVEYQNAIGQRLADGFSP